MCCRKQRAEFQKEAKELRFHSEIFAPNEIQHARFSCKQSFRNNFVRL